MTSLAEQIQGLMRRCPYESVHRPRIVNDLQGLSTSYHFFIKTVEFVNGANTYPLCCLDGNLPITIANQVYHIPIQILIPERYPMTAPALYIKPTPSMSIKVSQYVNAQGLITHQNLTTWTAKSSLRKVLLDLETLFSQQCPVYTNANYLIQAQTIEEVNSRILRFYEHTLHAIGEECKGLEQARRHLLEHSAQLQAAQQYTRSSIPAMKEKRLSLESYSHTLENLLVHLVQEQSQVAASPISDLLPKNKAQADLLHLIAADQAVDDTITLLEALFNKRQTTAETYLRELKSMYHQQFLIRKKQEKAAQTILSTRRT